jgi:hypothetical protein
MLVGESVIWQGISPCTARDVQTCRKHFQDPVTSSDVFLLAPDGTCSVKRYMNMNEPSNDDIGNHL